MTGNKMQILLRICFSFGVECTDFKHHINQYTLSIWLEGNVIFNNVLNTFYLQLYSKGPLKIVRGNLLPLHGLLSTINSKDSFICTIPDRIHTTAFVTPVVEHWLERPFDWTLLGDWQSSYRQCRKDEIVLLCLQRSYTSDQFIYLEERSSTSVHWQFATFWGSAIILLKQGRHLVSEILWKTFFFYSLTADTNKGH